MPASEVLEPERASHRAERRHGGGQERPGEDAAPAADGHCDAEGDPAETVGPAEHELRIVSARDGRDHQGAENADLYEGVDPDGREIAQAAYVGDSVAVAVAGLLLRRRGVGRRLLGLDHVPGELVAAEAVLEAVSAQLAL